MPNYSLITPQTWAFDCATALRRVLRWTILSQKGFPRQQNSAWAKQFERLSADQSSGKRQSIVRTERVPSVCLSHEGLGRKILNLQTRVRFPVALPFSLHCREISPNRPRNRRNCPYLAIVSMKPERRKRS